MEEETKQEAIDFESKLEISPDHISDSHVSDANIKRVGHLPAFALQMGIYSSYVPGSRNSLHAGTLAALSALSETASDSKLQKKISDTLWKSSAIQHRRGFVFTYFLSYFSLFIFRI